MSYKHRCWGKIRKIYERLGILLTHDEITFLCEHVLGAVNEQDFWNKYNEATKGMSKDEEIEWLKRMLKKFKRTKWLMNEEMEKEIMAYV